MKRLKTISICSVTVILLLVSGCTTKIEQIINRPGNPNVYDSAFPQQNTSKTISRILRSIKRISSSAYYKQYIYPSDRSIDLSDIKDGSFRKKAMREVSVSNSVAGTATILYNDGTRVLLLTCAHVVNFPDTVISYYKIPSDPESHIIKSVSIKQRQVNMLIDVPELGYYNVLAADSNADLALLGMSVGPFSTQDLPVFNYPLGKPQDLQWGSFIYVLGFPKGYKMVTQGIVSEPNRDNYGGFMMDALFNRGISGGIVLAIRNGVPNFEWVGVVNTVAASSDNVLRPDPNQVNLYDDYTPYDGRIFIDHQMNIEYGIDQVISVNRVRKFIKDHEKDLIDNGYKVDDILKVNVVKTNANNRTD